MFKKILLTIITLSFIGIASVLLIKNYNQNQNIKQLLEQNLDGRLMPHKVNYKNKLHNILSSDLHCFEFDLNFNEKATVPYFEVGHDEKELKGVSFEDYLNIIKDKKIKKIWMDVKNVSDENIAKMLERLNYLDKKYGIKNRIIFETSSTSSKVKLLSNTGYHTSYYLPITYFISKSSDKNSQTLKQQIINQGLKAVSFPSILYNYVNHELKPIISNDIVFHTWATYKFKNKDELKKIQKEEFYNDSRVKTILFTYDNNKLNRLYDFN